MQPYPYGAYPYGNGAPMPVRYMVPAPVAQTSPPFANQAFDRYRSGAPMVRPPPSMMQPMRYPGGTVPPGYRLAYPQPGLPMPPRPMMMAGGGPPHPQQPPQQPGQPMQPFYYNPNGQMGMPIAGYPPGAGPVAPPQPPPKKGAKEYKDGAFTIAPDGANQEAIRGLVSNHDINNLLKHKGTKVKVSKIYRITKTKPEVDPDDTSDDEYEQVPLESARSRMIAQPPPPQPQPLPPPLMSAQRRLSSSSSGSHCSTCSNCSCSECRRKGPQHAYDDCPDCRAEQKREQARRQSHR